MEATVNRVTLDMDNVRPLSAKTPKKAKPKKTLTLTGEQTSNARRAITIGMGIGIPALSVSFSSMGGTLLAQGGTTMIFGIVLIALCCVILAVSLPHLVSAISDITKSKYSHCVCMAIAIDLGIVILELTLALGMDSIYWSRLFVMLSLTVASMILNCWAFFNHNTKTKKK